ncbi:glycoside hydrolase family 16 protein [Amylostereum chailletii]|nr:glycoside hydrolase family 16 protein [Amylostereum chailletii]
MVLLSSALSLASFSLSAAALAINASLSLGTNISAVAPSKFKLVHKHQGNDFLDERCMRVSPLRSPAHPLSSKWSYFTGADPTNGKVQYLSKADAVSNKLATVQSDGTVEFNVQQGDLPRGQNRKSVRIGSVQPWSKGLIIADFKAMPYGCGVWPAFWTVGPNWPNGGELDIIEGINTRHFNQLTLHSGEGSNCTVDTNPGLVNGVPPFLAQPGNLDCRSTPDANTGCGFIDDDPNAYGSGFNSVDGRVFAVLRDDRGILIWSFQRSAVPADIVAGAPDPNLWSSPRAYFSSQTCDIDEHVQPQTIVLNTDVMGDFAQSGLQDSGCSTDVAGVVADGTNYANATWIVNYISLWE